MPSTLLRSRRFSFGSKLAAAAVAALALAAPALAEKLSITDLAPKNSILVAGIHDYKTMRASFDKTGLKAIWDEPTVKAWAKKHFVDKATKQFDNVMKEINADKDDVVEPTGMVGMAFWIDANAQDPSKSTPSFLLAADYGDGAEKMHKVLTSAIERGEKDKKFTVKEEKFGAHTITHLTFPKPSKDDAEAEREREREMGMDPLERALEDSMPPIENLFYARAGGSLLASSSLVGLESAIDRLDGKSGPSAEDNPDLKATLDQLGETHMFAAALIEPLYQLTDLVHKQSVAAHEKAAKNPDEFAPTPPVDVRAILNAVGLGDTRAASAGVRFDASEGQAVSSFGVLIPKKKGLYTLMDPPAAPFTPPAFVAADAASVSMLQFDFGGLFGVLDSALAALPKEMAEQAKPFLEMGRPTAAPILSNLGPEAYIVQTLERPFGPKSEKTTFALRVKDPAPIKEGLAQLPLEARDFQGNQIWAPPEGMGADQDIALSLAGGYLFVGPAKGVENAVRSIAAPPASTLAADAAFKKSMTPLKTSGLSFSYVNLRQQLDYYKWTAANMDKVIEAQFESLKNGADPDSKKWHEEMVKSAKEEIPAWMKDLPDLELIAKHLGDSITEVHATPDGYRGRSILLRPAK
ncbi:MAG: hypothetical protein IBJ11_08065 [Phycisphaerales bacterium]|nr:hypothetical protein [Phycisphaerales bacterium]